MIKVFCPKCDGIQKIDDSYRGGIYNCTCSSLLSVPEDAESVDAEDGGGEYEIDAPKVVRPGNRFGPYAQQSGGPFAAEQSHGEMYDEGDAYEAEYDAGGFDIGGHAEPAFDTGAYYEDPSADALSQLGGNDEGYPEERAPAAPPTGSHTPSPASAPGTSNSFDGSTCTVVIVEPDDDTAELIAGALVDFAFTRFAILPAASLSEAFEQIDAYEVDVVLTEMTLPDANGMDTIKRLLAVTKTLPNKPPVVVFSKFKDQKGILGVLKRGVQDFVVKGSMPLGTLPRVLLGAVQRQRMLVKLTQLAAEKIAQATQPEV